MNYEIWKLMNNEWAAHNKIKCNLNKIFIKLKTILYVQI